MVVDAVLWSYRGYEGVKVYASAVWQYIRVFYLSFGGYPLYVKGLEEYIVYGGDSWLRSHVCRCEEGWDVGLSCDYASWY